MARGRAHLAGLVANGAGGGRRGDRRWAARSVITHGARWPFRVIGMGYGLLAIVALIAGAIRQRRTAHALRRGRYEALSSPLVMWLTAAAVLLAVGILALIAVRF